MGLCWVWDDMYVPMCLRGGDVVWFSFEVKWMNLCWVKGEMDGFTPGNMPTIIQYCGGKSSI